MAGNMTARLATRPNTRNNTPQPQNRRVVRPVAATTTLPDAGFIKKIANNFIWSGGKQDVAHDEILKWLLSHTYQSTKVPDTDPFKAAYAKVSSNISAPYYWIRSEAGVPTPQAQASRFIRDFMQVQADNITISGWNGTLKIQDLAIGSNFSKDFDAIVYKINESIYAINPQFQPTVYLFKGVAHRDAIQIVPDTKKGRQFAGTISDSVTIRDNEITSAGALQGIFASDGAFRNLTISSNTVSTQGEHAITITGMLSGTISGNQTPTGKPVTLLPLRIGGGNDLNGNIYILGFSAIPTGHTANVDTNSVKNYWYETIKGGQAGIKDFRQKIDTSATPVIRRGIFYTNVNMTVFFQLYARYGERYQDIMNQLVRAKKATFVSFVGDVGEVRMNRVITQ
ncbi:hypothetical protein [Thiofilum flexile]|uniref:hypothetical protein n=1 Tax=Thiofilum flexile TaxID=125627 RepID=UPI00036A4315|nr:hypothetical protein [Thiofilum flexile]